MSVVSNVSLRLGIIIPKVDLGEQSSLLRRKPPCGLSEVIYNCHGSGLLMETAEYYFFWQMTSIILVCVLGT